MQITKHFASEPVVDESNGFTRPDSCESAGNPPQLATATDTIKNYRENPASIWYKDGTEPNDTTGKYAFQRLRQPCFIPHVVPKFKLLRDDKFYAINSCFARGIENALVAQTVIVESAAPEFAKVQPANRESPGPGFTNKYNTYSNLNQLRWTLDPDAEFSRDAVPAGRRG